MFGTEFAYSIINHVTLGTAPLDILQVDAVMAPYGKVLTPPKNQVARYP